MKFHNLRDTCLTHMAVRRDPPQDIQWRAGHTTPAMTEAYIANARYQAGTNFGTPLPPLPEAVLVPPEPEKSFGQVLVFWPKKTTKTPSNLWRRRPPYSYTHTSVFPRSRKRPDRAAYLHAYLNVKGDTDGSGGLWRAAMVPRSHRTAFVDEDGAVVRRWRARGGGQRRDRFCSAYSRRLPLVPAFQGLSTPGGVLVMLSVAAMVSLSGGVAPGSSAHRNTSFSQGFSDDSCAELHQEGLVTSKRRNKAPKTSSPSSHRHYPIKIGTS